MCNVLTEPATEDRFVARVEVVATGEQVAIRNVDELIALVRRLGDRVGGRPASAGHFGEGR